VAPFLAGCADDALGPEYGEIGEAESGLQFFAPGLNGGYRKFIYGQDERYVKRTIGVYGPKQGEYPHGQLILIEMPPRLYFPNVTAPRDSIDDWGQFENRAITHGPVGTAVNKIGRIDYAAFLADKLSCIIFRQTFGTAYGSGGGGTRLIGGYYCKGETPMMTKGEAVAIAKAIGHRKYGPIEPPEGWPGAKASLNQLYLVVVWDGGDGTKRLNGTAYVGEKDQQTELRIYVGARGSCHGMLVPDSGAGSVHEGTWELECGDGSKASGRYRTTGESAAGSGKDGDANKVSLTIEP
jgi:hypothetical protein